MSAREDKTSAVERAHRAIRDAVAAGEHAAGSMLSESQLADSLAMSRTPVRAALARLQQEGWVRIYPQRGALVLELTAAEVREAAEMRHALETAGVRLATSARRNNLENETFDNLARQQVALHGGDFSAFAELAADFHRVFVTLAENATMLEVYDRLRDRQYRSIMSSSATITDDANLTLSEHHTLVALAADGNWARFSDELQLHQQRSHAV